MLKNNNYKRTIFSWSIYDFANQPFTTITITFIYSVFFAKFIFTGEFKEGTELWAMAITISSLIIAFLSPVMGAIADNGGYRKLFLIFWTWVCIIFSFCLYFPTQGDVFNALLFFCIANIGFEMGGVFLNAYLPEIAPKDKIGRISGYGWSFGYIGGLVALGVCYALFMSPSSPIIEFLDLETGENYRIINVFIAIWFSIFSIPTFLYVKDNRKKKKLSKKIISDSFKNIKQTFNQIKKYKELTKFLIARIVYNDAIITVIFFGGQYATDQFKFETGELFLFAIVLNVFAGIGAFLLGFLDDILGGKKTIQITNFGFVIACLIAFLAPLFIYGESLFWFAGCLIGIFMGPNQASSRSLMGRLIPKSKENEFYGFFAFSGKATAFLGPLLFQQVLHYTGNMRWSILMIALLFVIGILLLKNVDEKEGVAIAQAD